ncbi:MAG: condensation domain-containing protein [Hyphomicrobium sp.]
MTKAGKPWPAKELATPFDAHAAPLVRAVLVNDDDRCVLILVAHHAIADGMSLVYLIRDVLRALGTNPLEVLPMLPAADDLLALRHSRPPLPALRSLPLPLPAPLGFFASRMARIRLSRAGASSLT